jgi:hypothetical protein
VNYTNEEFMTLDADMGRAYRMIKDDLTLDGTPTLNLASFVTTYMVSGSIPTRV